LVGSITKSFTAAGLGLLKDERRLAWQTLAVVTRQT